MYTCMCILTIDLVFGIDKSQKVELKWSGETKKEMLKRIEKCSISIHNSMFSKQTMRKSYDRNNIIQCGKKAFMLTCIYVLRRKKREEVKEFGR